MSYMIGNSIFSLFTFTGRYLLSPEKSPKKVASLVVAINIQVLFTSAENLSYELDGELVVLYDKLRDLIFNDTEKYYMESCNIPIFINEAGLNSDCRLSADSFAKLIQHDKSDMIPNFNKHLYLADCQFLVGTIQNLLCGIEDAFINYFVNISNINSIHYTDNPNTTIYVMSQSVRAISSILESYFIKTYSILDMVVKIAFEMQNPQEFFSEYPKMKSNKLLWGD